MDITGTFKLRKIDLVREGLDTSDPLYVRMDSEKTYTLLTAELREKMNTGVLRL